MRKSLIVALFMGLLFPLFAILATSPAQAGVVCNETGRCGTIRHISPDRGYDRAILVRCNFGKPASQRLVKEGRKSPCKDTDQIVVRKNEVVVCELDRDNDYNYPNRYFYHSRSPVKVFDHERLKCAVKRP